jgi:hypothetical protein
MSAWLTIKNVVYGEKEREAGWTVWLVDVTIVTYEVAAEPGKLFRVVLDDHLPEDDDLLRQVMGEHSTRHDRSRPEMRYEGDKSKPETLECVYTYRGKEYRLSYSWIKSLAVLYGMPDRLRDDILFWAKMLHNPD